MPTVRKPRRQHSLAYYAKIRARSRLLEKGIEEIPQIEMVGTEVEKIITKGLEDSQLARLIQNKDSENNGEILQNPSQSKAVARSSGSVKDLSKSTQVRNISPSALSTRPSTGDLSSQKACQNIEIENSRFEEVVEDSLSPMLSGGNEFFVDSLRVFVWASKAKFLQVGPGAIPPELHMVPPRTLPTVEKTFGDSFPALRLMIWVTVPKRGNSKQKTQPKPRTATSSGQSKKSATTQNQNNKTGTPNNGAAMSIPEDDHLFLRIPRIYE
ncbi:hypothetical protein EPUL_005591 [Erysiphe pulchra]|uniref:Uncharacterized protein n=1 Tax=Erysiphe pulchra TaxID=225359 RepID=A0A2S4PQF0_9PEZI|nr:hypothetical protein EPUL_005591 [Erysiphe pulchra]